MSKMDIGKANKSFQCHLKTLNDHICDRCLFDKLGVDVDIDMNSIIKKVLRKLKEETGFGVK